MMVWGVSCSVVVSCLVDTAYAGMTVWGAVLSCLVDSGSSLE